MKNERQSKILDIIQTKDIETQEQLLQELAADGLHVTQATISRDIRQLHLVKRMGANGVTRYAPSVSGEVPELSSKLQTIFRECVVSCKCAQNLVVIKTLPGLASAAASAIDKMGSADALGSLAGDDTAFIAMVSATAATALSDEICSLLG